MILTAENYFSHESNMEYMSVSQFKAFKKCPFAAMQELNGNYERAESTALLVGSYVDAHFEGTLDFFKARHPELFKRDGTLKADYVKAEEIIQRVSVDPFFMKYMDGQKQVIMTGEVEGVPVKIKIDSYHPGKAIVDGKVMRDMQPIFVPGVGKLNFIEAWNYDLQGAVYQEIVYQNTGDRLPFFIAAATKEPTTDYAVIQVGQEFLDVKLEEFKNDIRTFDLMKKSEIEASRCEMCDCCRQTKELNHVMTMEELNNYGVQ